MVRPIVVCLVYINGSPHDAIDETWYIISPQDTAQRKSFIGLLYAIEVNEIKDMYLLSLQEEVWGTTRILCFVPLNSDVFPSQCISQTLWRTVGGSFFCHLRRSVFLVSAGRNVVTIANNADATVVYEWRFFRKKQIAQEGGLCRVRPSSSDAGPW